MKKSLTIMLLVYALAACEKNKNTAGTVEKCYERVTTGNGITDRLVLQFEISSDSLTGKLDWLPQAKDQQRGTITGIRIGENKFNVKYNYLAEGTNNTETQTIVFDEDVAVIIRQHDGGAAFVTTDTLKVSSCSSLTN